MSKALLVLSATLLVCAMTLRAEERKADPAKLEAMVDKAMKAYNDEDAKAFFADYAKSMAAIATEQVFKNLYVDQAKRDFGKYVSREPIAAQTVTIGDFPLLVYQAKFEKNDKVKISVNFTFEDGAFKVMQIRFDKI
jgi:hypothetical protein